MTRKQLGRWTELGVAGLETPQRVRTIAFPTVREGVIPAYESIVQDTKRAKGYRAIVDARNGRLLMRHSIVHNAASGFRQAAVTVTPFSGTLPAVEGACGPNHFITIPAGIRAFSGFANATNPLTDIVLDMFRVGPPDVQLFHADSVFTPERFRYEPAGGVPPGDYYVRVCTFVGGGVPPEPRTYTGTLTLDDTPAPQPYWARWSTTPSSFPLGLEQDPWNRPSTDTREIWCWRAAPGCDRVVSNLASCSLGPRPEDGHADVHDDRQQRRHRGVVDERERPRSVPVPADEPGAGLRLPVDGLLEPERLQRLARVHARRLLGRLRERDGAVRRPQPDARLRLLAGHDRGELDCAGPQLRSHRAVAAERSGPR